MKRNVVLFGAYDRYNYGDNLMPIVFHDYTKKFHPEKFESFNFIFSSITESDLTAYHSPKTTAIKDVYNTLVDGDSIIAVGGEILCAPNSTLFLHMPRNKQFNDVLTKMNSLPVLRKLVQACARIFNPIPWDFPYLVDKSKLNAGVKVIYNTAGGSLNGLRPNKRTELANRLSSSDYISVRDTRTQRNLESINNVVLAPDSVHIISELYDDDYIFEKVSDHLKPILGQDYICFQAAPAKLSESIQEVISFIRNVSVKNNQKVVLLPIGYASGHDDFYLLEKINKQIPEHTELLYNLNVWEIMSIIKESNLYIGTSLHGAITALSFSVPHFGLNKEIYKLDGFLSDWSVHPYDQCYSLIEIEKMCIDIRNLPRQCINGAAKDNNDKVKENFERILGSIG
ncbi:polysaccharide pyruvyl transferase family protein [Vibrio natriegens]|uniref:polysaccharide pyruvyl transferase family protein n=1 Tax=Vibrio natriegens TaxID=691 RepID=UPI0008042335|nr:polysaccharide pyruvyl transferase family protein [Vibrio natriegens]ANQ25219.1 hypothetical protein BA894_01575 [Vibrio natriegens]MCY9875958.1 polysaccharide pyruvyl transferase family protein [Vibrio natriegens]